MPELNEATITRILQENLDPQRKIGIRWVHDANPPYAEWQFFLNNRGALAAMNLSRKLLAPLAQEWKHIWDDTVELRKYRTGDNAVRLRIHQDQHDWIVQQDETLKVLHGFAADLPDMNDVYTFLETHPLFVFREDDGYSLSFHSQTDADAFVSGFCYPQDVSASIGQNGIPSTVKLTIYPQPRTKDSRILQRALSQRAQEHNIEDEPEQNRLSPLYEAVWYFVNEHAELDDIHYHQQNTSFTVPFYNLDGASRFMEMLSEYQGTTTRPGNGREVIVQIDLTPENPNGLDLLTALSQFTEEEVAIGLYDPEGESPSTQTPQHFTEGALSFASLIGALITGAKVTEGENQTTVELHYGLQVASSILQRHIHNLSSDIAQAIRFAQDKHHLTVTLGKKYRIRCRIYSCSKNVRKGQAHP